uniref:T-box domain-containing protein n=1 Tax=Caenorhabditis tropicalis TaxID=1561998 RepID=A0A1I7T1H4_9PELO
MTDNMKYRYSKERKTWFPQSVADQKEPIFMEHHEGFQTGGYWNQEGIHFKQLFFSTKEQKSATMVVDSLRKYRTILYIMDSYGQDKKKAKEDVAKYTYQRKDEETTEPTAMRTLEVNQYEQFNYEQVHQEEYYDWRIDTTRVENQYAPANHQFQKPVEPAVYSLDDYFSMQ